MKITTAHNTYNHRISENQFAELFYEVEKELILNNYKNEVKVALYGVDVLPAGYGHWKVTANIGVNDNEVKISITTSDSIAYDAYRSEDEERSNDGFLQLLDRCIINNTDEIANAILIDEETE